MYKEKKYGKNIAKTNYRVYRTVKSTIDYHRGDNAITHSFKVQRCVPRSLSWSSARRLRVAAVCQTLLYIKSINKRTRVYLHFGVRNAIHFISVLFRIALYICTRAAMDVHRSCHIVLFVNFNEHRVNAKLARVAECIYSPRCRDRVDYWRRPSKWPVDQSILMLLRVKRAISVARNCRIDLHRCMKL